MRLLGHFQIDPAMLLAVLTFGVEADRPGARVRETPVIPSRQEPIFSNTNVPDVDKPSAVSVF